jgi:hypothetical protein
MRNRPKRLRRCDCFSPQMGRQRGDSVVAALFTGCGRTGTTPYRILLLGAMAVLRSSDCVFKPGPSADRDALLSFHSQPITALTFRAHPDQHMNDQNREMPVQYCFSCQFDIGTGHHHPAASPSLIRESRAVCLVPIQPSFAIFSLLPARSSAVQDNPLQHFHIISRASEASMADWSSDIAGTCWSRLASRWHCCLARPIASTR